MIFQTGLLVFRRVLTLCILASLAVAAHAQGQSASAAAPGAPVAPAVRSPALTKPLWSELSPAEQTALRPLAASWDTMATGQKRKWQSVAKDFAKLPPAQQSTLHARMNGWVAMSPQQRAAARQNFAANRELTDGLTPEQRQAQWQAYQQLSPEEKRKLAQSAPATVKKGAAPAATPQPVLKKEPTPEFGSAKALAKARTAPPAPAPGKKIAVAPHVVEQGSILPGTTKTLEK